MTKYRFWVKSSRMTDISDEVEIPWPDNDIPDDVIKSSLEDWCEEAFPMFHFTDAFVTYGYEKIET